MSMMKKGIVTEILLLSLLCGGSVLSMPQQASAKTTSKITKVLTLTSGKKAVTHRLSINAKEKVFVKLKVLQVKGKVSLASGEELFFGGYECKEGKGSFFSQWSKPSKLTKKSFKKGKTLKSKDDYVVGKSKVEWELPRGLKKLKVQITYYTKSGKAGIKSVK